MVVSFFGSFFRVALVLSFFAVAVWGIVQFVDNVPNEGKINSAVLFGMSLAFIFYVRPLTEDLCYEFKSMAKKLVNNDHCTKE